MMFSIDFINSFQKSLFLMVIKSKTACFAFRIIVPVAALPE